MTRRDFIEQGSLSAASILFTSSVLADEQGNHMLNIEAINPRGRVPVSFIIDDSTALVNMAYYGIPQFKEVFPNQYQQDWRNLPREIPDSFVNEFIGWCDDHGIKGKYSMVPFPACTGWLHRFIPGWTKQELTDSIRLVQNTVMPNWDIHPEMISHTRVIDIKTGIPYPDASPDFMENWEWSQTKSADELAAYMGYALNILKEAGLPCEGVTTPGGFGHKNMDNLALGTLHAVRDVFGAEIPHFFRNVITDPEQSVAPELFHVSGIGTTDPTCAVHIIGCTGDWFGGWDGLTQGDADKFITEDLSLGRMVEVIDSEEPAIMVCHWPGIYYNGDYTGFNIFKTVVSRLEEKYPDQLIWMKNSEIARYWAAKELTKAVLYNDSLVLQAPFATQDFTIKINRLLTSLNITHKGEKKPLQQISDRKELVPGTFLIEGRNTICCWNLEKGKTEIGI